MYFSGSTAKNDICIFPAFGSAAFFIYKQLEQYCYMTYINYNIVTQIDAVL